jgi:hypothetical protein
MRRVASLSISRSCGLDAEAYTPKELLKSSVGPHAVQPGPRVEPHQPNIALGVASLQMPDCGLYVAEPGVHDRVPERGNVPTRGAVVQLIEHAERFFPVSRDAEELAEARQSGWMAVGACKGPFERRRRLVEFALLLARESPDVLRRRKLRLEMGYAQRLLDRMVVLSSDKENPSHLHADYGQGVQVLRVPDLE